MAITLTKVFSGISDYITKHQDNYTIIEDAVNALQTALGGAASSSAVSTGLQQIFDRNGVIGKGSYLIAEGALTGNLLPVAAGAAWLNLSFRAQASGVNIDMVSFTTDDILYLDVDSAGIPSINTVSGTDTIWSFTWTAATDTISNLTRTVDILFDGDDYNDALTSSAQAKTFESMAERFEDIEGQLGAIAGFYAQDLGTTTGLTFGYQAGKVRNDNVVTATAASTIAMTNNDVNYVEVNATTGVVTTNLTGFTTVRIPLFEVTTSGGAITLVTDVRTWASLGGGGGGGHTQNTDTGTDATSFTLNNLEAGTPSANVSLDVERGTSANVRIRWNETTDKWQFTNDGTVYQDIGAIDIGTQELSKFVALEDPYTAVDLTASSTDGGYVQVDLTAISPFTTIADGVQGMLLRVQYDDSAPTGATTVLIRKIEDAAVSPTESMRVFALDSSLVDDKEGHVILTPGEGYDMSSVRKIGFEYLKTTSGAGTANLKIFVLGYWSRVTGVGTQSVTFTSTGNNVAANTTTEFNLPAFANRALIHKFTLTETGGLPTADTEVRLYKKDTFLADDLLYEVETINPASPYTDLVPTWVEDGDLTKELHIEIFNSDATQAAVYTVEIEMEVFA